MPKVNPLITFSDINALLDTYGKLLTTHQQSLMSDYYRFNLSLKEIADQQGISRAAVNDTLQKAKVSLYHFENTLKLKALRSRLKEWLDDESISPQLKKKIISLLK